jgi:hypothetical protein
MTQVPWTVIFQSEEEESARAEMMFGSINHTEMLNQVHDEADKRPGSWSVVGIIKGNFAGGFYADRRHS